MAREKRMELKKRQQHEAEIAAQHKRIADAERNNNDDDETDDDENDDDDYGPTALAGIWAGSKKLQDESELQLNDDEGDKETDVEGEEGRPSKRVRAGDNESSKLSTD